MRKALLAVLFISALLLAGCISEKSITDNKRERVSAPEAYDLDVDGMDELYFYPFGPNKVPGTDVTITKYMLVSAHRAITFKNFKTLTQDNADSIDTDFEEFKNAKDLADERCNQKLGLVGVRCVDPRTCVNLCAAASPKCKILAAEYPDVLGAAIIEYVKDNTDALNQISFIRKETPKLATYSAEKKEELAVRFAQLYSSTAAVDANPLLQPSLFGICDQNDYALGSLKQIIRRIGAYESSDISYNYRIFLKVDSDQSQATKQVYNDVVITEVLPPEVGAGTQVTSPQPVTFSTKNGIQSVTWPDVKPYSKKSEILAYSFASNVPPDEMANKLQQPLITLNITDLGSLGPTIAIFGLILKLTSNYYLALGLSFGITVIFLFFAYTVIAVAYNILKVRLAGEAAYVGIKRSIGKTAVRWKNDALLGIVIFGIGLALAFLYAPPGQMQQFNLFQAGGMLLNNVFALLATFGVFAGSVLLYLSFDNYVRISLLEKIYGKEFKDDRDLFLAQVAQLKAKLEELRGVVEKYATASFEVGSEYDLISRIPVQHINELAAKADPNSRRSIENYLNDVENALEGLQEKKKTSDDNWQKWSAAISALVEGNQEVYVSNLVSIPSSLRLWALNRFVKEHPELGLVLEGEVIKKRTVSAESLVGGIVDKKLLNGIVVVKSGKLFATKMAEGSGTLPSVMTLRLLGYLRSLAAKLHLHNYENVAVVGERNVLALIKYKDVESVLFIPKDKFKEAIDDWKLKIKSI